MRAGVALQRSVRSATAITHLLWVRLFAESSLSALKALHQILRGNAWECALAAHAVCVCVSLRARVTPSIYRGVNGDVGEDANGWRGEGGDPG